MRREESEVMRECDYENERRRYKGNKETEKDVVR